MNKPLQSKFQLVYNLIQGIVDDSKTIQTLIQELENEVDNELYENDKKIDDLTSQIEELEKGA